MMKTPQELHGIMRETLLNIRDRFKKTGDEKGVLQVNKTMAAYRLLYNEPAIEPDNELKISRRLIREAIFYATGIDYNTYRMNSRKRKFVDCRKIEAFLCCKYMGLKPDEIAAEFDGKSKVAKDGTVRISKDRTTIIDSLNSTRDLLVTDAKFSKKYKTAEKYVLNKFELRREKKLNSIESPENLFSEKTKEAI